MKSNDFFPPINADDEANTTTEVESYCVNCGKNVSKCLTIFNNNVCKLCFILGIDEITFNKNPIL
jgi:hypothetical protein